MEPRLYMLEDLYLPPKLREATEADLASLGYVKRPDINWDTMREIHKVVKDFGSPWALDHFEKVLAALDQEDSE